MTAGFLNFSVWRLMALPEIKTVEDVKGKTIAVTRIGNADYFGWQEVMAKQGWKEGDLKFAAANDNQGQVALLSNGQAQAALFSPPVNIQAERVGAHEI